MAEGLFGGGGRDGMETLASQGSRAQEPEVLRIIDDEDGTNLLHGTPSSWKSPAAEEQFRCLCKAQQTYALVGHWWNNFVGVPTKMSDGMVERGLNTPRRLRTMIGRRDGCSPDVRNPLSRLALP